MRDTRVAKCHMPNSKVNEQERSVRKSISRLHQGKRSMPPEYSKGHSSRSHKTSGKLETTTRIIPRGVQGEGVAFQQRFSESSGKLHQTQAPQ
eukprot:6381112-Amphidinium_carterae.1